MKVHNPKNEAELAELVKESFAKSQTIEIQGGGTRPIGNPVQAEVTASTSKINGISLYEPGALTIVANAGTSVAEVQKVLAKENQHLPFEPTDFSKLLDTQGTPTIGSVVATANSGPRRIQVGAARDALIGVRFVTGEGEIIKNGGRVMKNVTGYDLVKLMCGSHGTLGIISEVSFKVLPRAEKTSTVLIYGQSDENAIKLLSKALGSPFDISGAAHTQNGLDGEPVTMIRVEGFAKSVAYRAEKLRELLAQFVGTKGDIQIETDSAKTSAGWKWIRDVEKFHGVNGAVWKVSVKPTDGPKFVSELSKTIDVQALYDWGGGLVWILVSEDNEAHSKNIRELMKKYVGHSTLIRANETTRNNVEAFQPEYSRLASISQNLRSQFDPMGILNPGRMVRQKTNMSGTV